MAHGRPCRRPVFCLPGRAAASQRLNIQAPYRDGLSKSISKTILVLEVRGKCSITCELKRHLSPRTIGYVLRALPLKGNAHRMGRGIVYLESPVDSGIERSREEFKKGDVAFLPANGGICFFTRDGAPKAAMGIIGRATGDVESLDGIEPGDVMELYAAGL